jgi:hypothetical protein
MMAVKKKIGPRYRKYLEEHYDPVLRSLPLFTAVPTLALLAVDLNRYVENSALHNV